MATVTVTTTTTTTTTMVVKKQKNADDGRSSPTAIDEGEQKLELGTIEEVDGVEYINNVVVVDYKDLADDGADLSRSIEAAYGPRGLGIIVVRNVPQMVERRAKLLPLANKFARLPEDVKAKYEHDESYWNFGWSHGKENLDGKPDFSKGSYYNNPLHDRPFDDAETIKAYPSFCTPNIWPKEEMPELRPAFMDMGKLIVSVGMLVAKHCDRYIHKQCPQYGKSRMTDIITKSKICKARLLHYFALDGEEKKKSDVRIQKKAHGGSGGDDDVNLDKYSTWCGWHNDHGSLTGLCPAMYMDKDGKQVPTPDKTAGLYIRSRQGKIVKAAFPKDCLAFQVGETQQIHSGGIVQATPHAVRASDNEASRGVSRETFAVFMEPEMPEPMAPPEGRTPAQVMEGSNTRTLPAGVPPLSIRWEAKMKFSEFTQATLKAYH